MAIQDIMRYESDIWNVADDLRGASIKESDWRNAGLVIETADGDYSSRMRSLTEIQLLKNF